MINECRLLINSRYKNTQELITIRRKGDHLIQNELPEKVQNEHLKKGPDLGQDRRPMPLSSKYSSRSTVFQKLHLSGTQSYLHMGLEYFYILRIQSYFRNCGYFIFLDFSCIIYFNVDNYFHFLCVNLIYNKMYYLIDGNLHLNNLF